MSVRLAYGTDRWLTLDSDGDSTPVVFAAPRGQPLGSVVEAVTAALSAPREYPPLEQALVPGDQVVLALEPGVPQLAEVVDAVIRYLMLHGVTPTDIWLVETAAEHAARTSARQPLLADDLDGKVRVEVHDPSDRVRLSFLAATKSGRPVYLNRRICEADLVVPIGCFRGQRQADYHGIHPGLYPTFSDEPSLNRFRNPRLTDVADDTRRKAQKEIDSIEWLSGIRFSLQVVAGAGDRLLHILAGDCDAVLTAAQGLWQAAWQFSPPAERAELVVAAVPADAAACGWDDLARALAAGQCVVQDGGMIALCTDLALAPGPAMTLLAEASDREAALREIRKNRLPDALMAAELDRAQSVARVLLLGQFDEMLLTDLGITPVSNPADIERLIRRHRSCVALAAAQHIAFLPAEADQTHER